MLFEHFKFSIFQIFLFEFKWLREGNTCLERTTSRSNADRVQKTIDGLKSFASAEFKAGFEKAFRMLFASWLNPTEGNIGTDGIPVFLQYTAHSDYPS